MRLLKAGAGTLVVLALAFGVFTWWSGRTDAVFASVVDPVATTIRPPQYVAYAPYPTDTEPSGLVMRAGAGSRAVVGGTHALWLNDGRLLVATTELYKCEPTDRYAECSRGDVGVLDVASGRTTPVPGIPRGTRLWELPGEGLHRVNLAVPKATHDAPVDRPVSFAPDLTSRTVLDPPTAPDGRGTERSLGSRVFTIGGWHYVRFSDTIGQQTSDEYGYLRAKVGSSSWEKVLLDQRLVKVWVSRDGRALLGLQQQRGEPCGGCTVKQQVVEIDPEAGTIAATYGVPDGYDKTWRVGDVDKVADRVLVRYVHTTNVPENLGTWQYDGDWSLVPGTDGVFTWWQGPDDRIEAVPTGSGERAGVELFWVHDSKRTRLPGQLPPFELEQWRGAPGSLVPLG